MSGSLWRKLRPVWTRGNWRWRCCSRVWRKVKGDWDAWNALLKDEPIIRLILDGTVVRVRLSRALGVTARNIERRFKRNVQACGCMGVHFSSKTAEWTTPQDFFDKLDAEFHFTVDLCATPENAKYAAFFSRADNGLVQTWTGTCWLNLPKEEQSACGSLKRGKRRSPGRLWSHLFQPERTRNGGISTMAVITALRPI